MRASTAVSLLQQRQQQYQDRFHFIFIYKHTGIHTYAHMCIHIWIRMRLYYIYIFISIESLYNRSWAKHCMENQSDENAFMHGYIERREQLKSIKFDTECLAHTKKKESLFTSLHRNSRRLGFITNTSFIYYTKLRMWRWTISDNVMEEKRIANIQLQINVSTYFLV